MYQRNELALNKTLSIKPLEVIWYMLRKLGFKLNIIEAELNSPDAYIKQSIVCSNLNEIWTKQGYRKKPSDKYSNIILRETKIVA